MQVEVWSDIACPWCYVGKRRFEAALAGFEHRDDVEVVWRSFELDPGAPQQRDVDHADHLASKYGVTRERALEMNRSLAETAAGDGLDMRFDIARGGNTFDAHRLVHLAATHSVQEPVLESMFRAYFTEGRAIGDSEELAEVAVAAGLPAEEVREVLATERFAEEVRDDERTAGALGISAVPFFVVDRSFGASGAHPSEALRKLLERGWTERAPAIP